MPQLQINQGPQDALLYDNTRSYFTNVGYVRTSNFQVEYRDVDSQNTAQLGSTVQYVIPKAADLLGPVDLQVTINAPDAAGASGTLGANARAFAQWVDELGFAMIEKCTFSVGSNDIETITGEQMQIKNELMTSDEQRLGYDHIMKTGRRAFSKPSLLEDECSVVATANVALAGTAIAYTTVVQLSASGQPQAGDLVYNATPALIGKIASVAIATDKTGTITLGDITTGTTKTTGLKIAVAANDVLTIRRHTTGTHASERPGDNQSLPLAFHKNVNKDYTRLITYNDKNDERTIGGTDATAIIAGERKLIIPLALFFTKHVSQYFPLAAVAGCNDVRISIKFRSLQELIQIHDIGATQTIDYAKLWTSKNALSASSTKLRCHYVHVTGPEATTLMNKEHVRLLKLWQHQHQTFTSVGTSFDMDLSFLHPVTTLIVTIRRFNDMTTSTSNATADSAQKGFFFYHGDGTNPNFDRALDPAGTPNVGASLHTVKVSSMQLTLNGQERHPGLDKGLDRKYLNHRLLPMLHSNSNAVQKQLLALDTAATSGKEGSDGVNARNVFYELQGSKNILVYPFSLNPEGSNPSGAVNFSKVSHAKLKIFCEESEKIGSPLEPTTSGGTTYRVDVYGLYYNWLQIKDGRALLSFA